MRRIFGFIFVLLTLVLIGVAAAVFLVPKEVYKQKIEQQASQLTGRQVQINGDISLSFFPSILAKASNVRISNPPGFSNSDFASMEQMQVGVKLMPLFAKRVEITKFVLVKPVISLEKKRNNAVNWALGSGKSASSRARANKGFSRAPGALPLKASLGDVRIVDGKASYLDRTTGAKTTMEAINLRLSLPNLNKKMRLSGKLRLNKVDYSLDANLGSLRKFLEGDATAFTFDLNSNLIRLSFDGDFVQSKNLDFAGSMQLVVPSVKKLAEAGGQSFTARPNTFENFSIQGQVKANPKRLSFSNANLEFDQIRATGSFSAILGANKPKLAGNLKLATLDINPYILPPPPKGTAIPPWSKQVFSLNSLAAANGNFKLDIGTMRVRNIDFGATQLTAKLLNARLEAILSETSLYGGAGTGRVVINGRGAKPSFSMKFDLDGLQVLPLFEAAAGFKKIDGVGKLQMQLLGAGNSMDALMKNLSGTTQMQVRDGAILGVNLASVLRNAQSYLLTGSLPQNLNSEEKTDFSELSGTFQIAKGVARNTDMLMRSPMLRVSGNGNVDLGAQTLDYRLAPKAVASLKGQGGIGDLKGLSAPFRIRGPWNNVKAGLDMQGLQKQLGSRAKSEARKLIKDNVGGQLGSLLDGFLGAEPEPEPDTFNADTTTTEPTDEEKALNILGGLFGLGNKDQPEDDPATDTGGDE
ncbi:hypothetical protein MNBD_ALPHA06-784 [hydrothermal vent metagenome]|uniref:AsmA domain-containing protein n=1 Tax=hydrothermal vent metagenome TaxID=652676 RepID=A0A3B0RBU6_9ZZZZ